MHPNAKLAWGIDLGDPEYTSEGYDWEEAGTDRNEFDDKVMPGLFGFTEEAPSCPPGTDWVEWDEKVRAPYIQRLDAAVPLTVVTYSYEMSGSALVLKRSLAVMDEEGAVSVDPATLAPPTPAELAAFAIVTEHLGYDSPVRLLLMAEYS